MATPKIRRKTKGATQLRDGTWKCDLCGAVAKNRAGIASHLRFSHGQSRTIPMPMDTVQQLLCMGLKGVYSMEDPKVKRLLGQSHEDELAIKLGTGRAALEKVAALTSMMSIAAELDQKLVAMVRHRLEAEDLELDEILALRTTVSGIMSADTRQINDLLGARERGEQFVNQILNIVTTHIHNAEERESKRAQLRKRLGLPAWVATLSEADKEALRQLWAQQGVGEGEEGLATDGPDNDIPPTP